MAFELGTYGFMAGFLYFRSQCDGWKTLYTSLLVAMVSGRVVWGITKATAIGFSNFTLNMFVAGAVLNAVPGIIIQLTLIPLLIAALKRAKFIPLKCENKRD